MTNKDVAIGAVGVGVPGAPSGAIYAGNTISGSPISKKPHYLLLLEDTTNGKAKSIKKFIVVDKPDFLPGFVQVKGLFVDVSEDEIIKRFGDIVNATPKERQVEIMFPATKVLSIRSLIFNAVKPIMVNK
jgi:hypothetical protein